MRIRTIIIICITSLLAATLVFAQGRFRSPFRRGRTTQTLQSDLPTWKNDPEFTDDVFTFARIQYDSYASGYYSWWDNWDNDYPDADYNFSYRLQQLTSLKVNPNYKLLRLTDPELFNYPFIYFSGVQKMVLSRAEQAALRKYLLNGGFAMMSDFWNPQGWANVLSQMRSSLSGQGTKRADSRPSNISHRIRFERASSDYGFSNMA